VYLILGGVAAGRDSPTVAPSGFALVWSDELLAYNLGPAHPFQQRYRRLGVELHAARSGRASDRPTMGSRLGPAPRAELSRFHEERYLERVLRVGEAVRPSFLDGGDTPGFPGCFDAAAMVVQGTLTALERLLDGRAGQAFAPGGGLHHAGRAAASGFCIFNDVAIAIARALDGPSPIRRVAYVDVDAHHGDGVMYGFYEDGRVLDLDFHQDGRTLFPGTGALEETGRGDGAGLKLNVPMPPGTGDPVFLSLFRRLVPPLLEEFRPELVVLQHGLDGHRGDPLAALELTSISYRAVVEQLRDVCQARGIPLLVTGGGGYRPEHVSRGVALIAGLLDAPTLAPRPHEELPAAFREAFYRETGEIAPRKFEEDLVRFPSHPLPVWAEATLDALATSTGRKF
jgi:acetoin utilization protein AcuC